MLIAIIKVVFLYLKTYIFHACKAKIVTHKQRKGIFKAEKQLEISC